MYQRVSHVIQMRESVLLEDPAPFEFSLGRNDLEPDIVSLLCNNRFVDKSLSYASLLDLDGPKQLPTCVLLCFPARFGKSTVLEFADATTSIFWRYSTMSTTQHLSMLRHLHSLKAGKQFLSCCLRPVIHLKLLGGLTNIEQIRKEMIAAFARERVYLHDMSQNSLSQIFQKGMSELESQWSRMIELNKSFEGKISSEPLILIDEWDFPWRKLAHMEYGSEASSEEEINSFKQIIKELGSFAFDLKSYVTKIYRVIFVTLTRLGGSNMMSYLHPYDVSADLQQHGTIGFTKEEIEHALTNCIVQRDDGTTECGMDFVARAALIRQHMELPDCADNIHSKFWSWFIEAHNGHCFSFENWENCTSIAPLFNPFDFYHLISKVSKGAFVDSWLQITRTGFAATVMLLATEEQAMETLAGARISKKDLKIKYDLSRYFSKNILRVCLPRLYLEAGLLSVKTVIGSEVTLRPSNSQDLVRKYKAFVNVFSERPHLTDSCVNELVRPDTAMARLLDLVKQSTTILSALFVHADDHLREYQTQSTLLRLLVCWWHHPRVRVRSEAYLPRYRGSRSRVDALVEILRDTPSQSHHNRSRHIVHRIVIELKLTKKPANVKTKMLEAWSQLQRAHPAPASSESVRRVTLCAIVFCKQENCEAFAQIRFADVANVERFTEL